MANKKVENHDIEDLHGPMNSVAKEDARAMQAGTTKENPIASLLLQEGMHISLRLGYSSDPDLLDTVFNGVITEVEFSESDDLVRVLAQSYAIELVQDLKGFQKPDDQSSFGLFGWDFWGFKQNASTGKILEEMISEPEVLHFGRWKPKHQPAGTPFRELLTNKWQFTPNPADDNIFAPSFKEDLSILRPSSVLSTFTPNLFKLLITLSLSDSNSVFSSKTSLYILVNFSSSIS